jgi:eukaryotic-like serine/threonine-protein kinase
VGYVSVESPVEMQLLENGKLVGTSRMDRIILPAGPHEIRAVNEAFGFSATQKVNVAADKATKMQFDIPTAKVSVNAIPWAEVTIDGKSVGQTPLGNLSVAIGSHEIVYKHPQLGEQRQTVTVTVSGPNRFSAAMRK